MRELVELLIEKNLSVSTMESCTGGGLVNAITNIPNASKIISFSAVTYSNEAKIKMGVSKETIDQYSVYSIEVANEMAKSISEYTMSDYGIGITGKLKKQDENNLSSENDKVYFCIYDRNNTIYYTDTIQVTQDERIDNKQEVINQIVEKMISVVK